MRLLGRFCCLLLLLSCSVDETSIVTIVQTTMFCRHAACHWLLVDPDGCRCGRSQLAVSRYVQQSTPCQGGGRNGVERCQGGTAQQQHGQGQHTGASGRRHEEPDQINEGRDPHDAVYCVLLYRTATIGFSISWFAFVRVQHQRADRHPQTVVGNGTLRTARQ